MSVLDTVIVVVYLVVLVLIGYFAGRGVKTNEDAVVAGRSFKSFTAAVGKAANLAGGSTSVGGTGYGYTFGLSGMWYGLSNLVTSLLAAPFCKRIWKAMQRGKFISIGEYLGYRFGRPANLIANLLNLFAYMGFVASQVVATGTICHALLGWDLNLAMVITTVVVILYTCTGGLKAVVYTDYMQLFVLFLGMIFILLPKSVSEVGGVDALISSLPASFMDIGAMGWFTIIGVIVVPTVLNTVTMQAFYGYLASCRDEKAAWKSSVQAGFLYIFPAMAVVIIGMCAVVLYPDLASSNDALPTMILSLLPQGLVGVLFAACIAATMSTSDTCLLCSATCFTNIYREFIKKDATDKEVLRVSRISMAVIGLGVLLITMVNQDIISLITMGYALGVGGLLVPFFACYFSKRATSAGCLAAMLVGGISYLILSLTVSWPPLFVSLPASAVAMIVVSALTPAPDPKCYDLYFDEEWEKAHPEG
ncbi:hypothetical protein LKD70_04020 [Ruminococcus sp. CLA-AA-H200]|uniref:Sodium:solute symporter family protein n=1 Tax=Ruminococcus turbiniformis TaxID=2881258 RepID=A0ABS8FU86_9FIRM|nr:hypothetical protein [Ruminococcus turbiniformis]MCC2253611.1 hypothetical protein [Ruminococcus turbiniformis]